LPPPPVCAYCIGGLYWPTHVDSGLLAYAHRCDRVDTTRNVISSIKNALAGKQARPLPIARVKRGFHSTQQAQESTQRTQLTQLT